MNAMFFVVTAIAMTAAPGSAVPTEYDPATGPGRWFTPNLFPATDIAPSGSISTRYNAAVSAAAFNSDWLPFIRDSVDVVEFFASTVKANTDSIMTRAVPMLMSNSVAISLGTAGVRGYGAGTTPGPLVHDGTMGSISAGYDLTQMFSVIEGLGGTVAYVAMDQLTRRTITNGAGSARHSAFVTINPAGANNSMKYTAATAGAAGNGIRVKYAVLGSNSALSLTVTSDSVTYVQDAFTRTVASGWSTADTGGAWTAFTSGGTLSTNGTKGLQAITGAPAQTYAYAAVAAADQIAMCSVTLSALPVGAPHAVGIWLRFTDANNHYRCNATFQADGRVIGSLLKVVSGVATTIDTGAYVSGLTVTPSMKVWLAAQVVGTSLALRVWQDGTDRPAEATNAATSTTLATGTNVAFAFGNTSLATTDITASFDDVSVSSVPTTGDITVNLATDANGTVTTTATLAKAAIDADATARLLLSVANVSPDTGAGAVAAVAFTNLAYGDDGYNWTAAEIATELISYMNTILATRPTALFVWHDSAILAPYDGVAGYAAATYPAGQQPDFKETIDTICTALSVAGLLTKLYAFWDDSAYEYDEGLVASQNSAADDWYQRHIRIQQQFATYGVRYQRSFTSYWGWTPGATGAPSTTYASDEQGQTNSLANLAVHVNTRSAYYSGVPLISDIRAAFFQYHPRVLAPATTAYSTMDTAERMFGAIGPVGRSSAVLSEV